MVNNEEVQRLPLGNEAGGDEFELFVLKKVAEPPGERVCPALRWCRNDSVGWEGDGNPPRSLLVSEVGAGF